MYSRISIKTCEYVIITDFACEYVEIPDIAYSTYTSYPRIMDIAYSTYSTIWGFNRLTLYMVYRYRPGYV